MVKRSRYQVFENFKKAKILTGLKSTSLKADWNSVNEEIGDFKVRELPKFKCATILYTGPGPRIGEAWVKLYKAIGDKGLTPTDEERELYLYWEGVDSPNNIVQVMVGVK